MEEGLELVALLFELTSVFVACLYSGVSAIVVRWIPVYVKRALEDMQNAEFLLAYFCAKPIWLGMMVQFQVFPPCL